MKRSDAIEIIYGLVSVYTDESCCNLGFNRESADEILLCLEVAGMLPPDNGDTDEFGYSARTFEWEPEDEESKKEHGQSN